MFFRSNEIFNEARYRQLITDSTSDGRVNLEQIKSSAKKNIPAYVDSIARNTNEQKESIYKSDESSSGSNTDSQFPPVGVEPICVDKITINFKVSKVNDANNENAV